MVQDAPTRAAPEAVRQTTKPGRRRGPVRLLLDVFSSVRLGVALLTVLFVYATLGSAGIVYPVGPNIFDPANWRHDMVRQYAMFEMTEFEWFHTRFFIALCVLIGVNIVVTTLRRIPLRVVNLGVWMIHTGIVTLIVGSVIYFSTKIEGDTPVFRRAVHVSGPGLGEVTLPALPGRSASFGEGASAGRVTIVGIDPEWPVGGGAVAYSVSLLVEAPGEPPFIRRVTDGDPDAWQDAALGGEAGSEPPPVAAGLRTTLETVEQTQFWIKDSAAIGVRPIGRPEWTQRVVSGLPRYNDYVGSNDAVWPPTAGHRPSRFVSSIRRTLDVEVPPASTDDDPLAGLDVRVTGALRYAVMQERLRPGGDRRWPIAHVRMRSPGGGSFDQHMAAFDPERRVALDGLLEFRWAADETEFASMLERLSPALRVTAPARDGGEVSASLDLTPPPSERPAVQRIDGSDWVFEVQEVVRGLPVDAGRSVSLAILRVTPPDGAPFVRWVFEDPALTRDMPMDGVADHAAPGASGSTPDGRLAATFRAGSGATLIVAAGPEPAVGLRLLTRAASGRLDPRPLRVNEPIAFGGGAELVVNAVSEYATAETRPFIVPMAQRDRDADTFLAFAMIRLRVASPDGWSEERWIPYHKYSLPEADLALPGLGRYEPVVFEPPGVGPVEVIFTRERRPLPSPVVLEDFVLSTHLGGFTGDGSIRDWTSEVRFVTEDGPSDVIEVRSNGPGEFGGLRFFQSYWDAPTRRGPVASAGMNFTGLGVGNREGVATQLAGSAIAVIGMIYAFYVKPIIKRRRRDRVLEELRAREAAEPAGAPEPKPIMQPTGAS